MGSESLQYDMAETKENIENLAAANGLEIKANFYTYEDGSKTEDSSQTFGIKDNVTWFYDDENSGSAFVSKDDNYTYCYSLSDGEWYYQSRIETSEYNESFSTEVGFSWMYSAHAYDGTFVKKGTTSVCGRTCDIYECSVNAVVEKMSYTFAIDQQTGITMKSEVSASVLNESASTGFVVTSFKTSSITTPNLPPVEE